MQSILCSGDTWVTTHQPGDEIYHPLGVLGTFGYEKWMK
jgi:hypothetical protein